MDWNRNGPRETGLKGAVSRFRFDMQNVFPFLSTLSTRSLITVNNITLLATANKPRYKPRCSAASKQTNTDGYWASALSRVVFQRHPGIIQKKKSDDVRS